MVNNEYQPSLLDNATIVMNLPDADLALHPQFVTGNTATAWFEQLMAATPWRQERITLYGKTHDVPRLSSWVADPGLAYAYSNMTMNPEPWSALLRTIKAQVEATAGHSFNSVLLNYYRDGKDANGWHADDEPELGIDPVIASLSLGASRDFHLRNKRDKTLRHNLKLEHGSLLIMRGRTQACWQHHIPRRAVAGPRINLTFRTIVSPPGASV